MASVNSVNLVFPGLSGVEIFMRLCEQFAYYGVKDDDDFCISINDKGYTCDAYSINPADDSGEAGEGGETAPKCNFITAEYRIFISPKLYSIAAECGCVFFYNGKTFGQTSEHCHRRFYVEYVDIEDADVDSVCQKMYEILSQME